MPTPRFPHHHVFQPGGYVRHPERPDWGLGQVQSVMGVLVTVNFEHAGKQTINADVVELAPATPGESGS